MPSFHDSADAAAPPEEVWKLLYDPARFPDWWAGIGTVELGEERGPGETHGPDEAHGPDGAHRPGEERGPSATHVPAGGRSYTMYPEGYPDFPMAQLLDTAREEQRVTVSCLVSDLRFEWVLEPLADGGGTRITVAVEIPAAEAARLERQRETIRASLAKLAALSALTVD